MVLLGSVSLSRCLLLIVHALTIYAFYENKYIVIQTLYAAFLNWYLDNDSDRRAFHLSYHSLTLTVTSYFLIRGIHLTTTS